MNSKTQQWRLAQKLLSDLADFKPFIWHGHERSPSIYIHFENLPQQLTHKLRVSDHAERERYGYKWQLRIDGLPSVEERKQFSIYFDNTDSLVRAFKRYYEKVQEATQ